MHPTDFRLFVQEAQAFQLELLDAKGQEYSSEADKFENCRRGARILGCKPSQFARYCKAKHEVSVEMIMDGTVDATPELLREKFTDLANWDYIIHGLLLEELG